MIKTELTLLVEAKVETTQLVTNYSAPSKGIKGSFHANSRNFLNAILENIFREKSVTLEMYLQGATSLLTCIACTVCLYL